jgi:hypothetical protein
MSDNPWGYADAADRARIYVSLRDSIHQRRESTRRVEWLVDGALWAGILLAVAKMPPEAACFVKTLPWCAIVLSAVGAGLLHFGLWMVPIHLSQSYARACADAYMVLALDAMQGAGADVDRLAKWRNPETAPAKKTIRNSLPHPPDEWLTSLGFAGVLSVITGLLVLFTLSYARQISPCPPKVVAALSRPDPSTLQRT